MKQVFKGIFEPLQTLNLSQKQLLLITGGGILTLLTSIFLVSKTLSVNPRSYQSYQDDILKLQELEAVFNQEVLRSRYELFTSYDLLVRSLVDQKLILQALQEIPGFVDGKQQNEIQQILDQKQRTLEEKENLSEWFKSRNALLKNSLRYLPLLTSQLEDKFEAKQQSNQLDSEQISTLRNTLNRLIQNVLLYNVSVDEQLAEEVKVLAEQLSQLDIEYGLKADQFPTQLVNSHTNIILQTKPQVEELTTRLITSDPEQREDLEQIFQASYQQAINQANLYRLVSAFWFVGLFILFNYWLWRRSRYSADSGLSQYQRKIDAIVTDLTVSSTTRSTLNLDREKLQQISLEIQDQSQQFKTEESQLLQQISELNTQLETKINEQKQIEIAAEQEKINQQILELSMALEKARHHKNKIVISKESEAQVAHLSLLTTEQKKLFTPEMLTHLQTIFSQALSEQNCELIEFQGYSEQVRLWFSYPLQIQLSELVTHLKEISSRSLHQEFLSAITEINDSISIWSDTYFITVSENKSNQAVEINKSPLF